MFNLEKEIAGWRKKMQAKGRLEDGEVEELESHLWDRISYLMQEGQTAEVAFGKAMQEMGSPEEIGAEHLFARERKAWQVTRTFLPALLTNYLKIMTRQIGKHRMHTWVTMGGLAVGIASCLLIAFYTLHELSYDKTYAGKSIYRVVHHSVSSTGSDNVSADGPISLGPALKDEFAEIKSVTRFWRTYMPIVRSQEKVFQENEFMFADTSVFAIFNFPLVKGQPSSVFQLPNSVVISEQIAAKYFGDQDPLGNIMEYSGDDGGKVSFIVTGVFKDLPANTHFKFDFLASFLASPETADWGSFKPLWTYVELNQPQDADQLLKKLPAFVGKYLADRKANSNVFEFILEPVSSIHLYSHAGFSMKAAGNLAMIKVIVLTGVLILIMSCVNFINISFAKMMGRLKEVAMRKVLGAIRRQLLFQFITEIIISFGLSLIVAGIVIALASPTFTILTGVPITGSSVLNWPFAAVVLALFVFVVVVAGYIPARTLSSYGILDAFRNKAKTGSQGNPINVRNGLIFLQISISGMLIFSILIIHDQLDFIKSKDLGIKIQNVVAVPFSKNREAFENRLLAVSGVESIGYSQRLPVNTLNYDGRIIEVPASPDALPVQSSFITPGFLETYHIQFLSGRNLRAESPSDSNKFIINETLMKTLGWNLENSIGQKVKWSTYFNGEVVGVIKDFHLESVHTAISPMILLKAGEEGWQRNFISVRIDAKSRQTALASIEKIWKEFNPQEVYTLVDMPESFSQLHAGDEIFAELIFYFTVIAIFISAIGLYAVSSYTAEQSRKEIGIRKVLGSRTAQIAYQLAAPFLWITGLSFVVVIPTVWFLMTQWLQTFAYAAPVSWMALATSAIIIMAVTLVSVLKESLRAAMVNPIRFLKEE